jgi:dihydrofolate synthase/folylpolyglutamate synthase
MKDFGRSDDPRVQAQLDRLSNLTLREGRINLDTVRELFDRLGNPQDRLPPVFHVAGTNGKGSTCAFLRAMLEAEGYRVHATTSPHLVRYNERIRVAGELISDARLAELLEEVFDAAEGLEPSFFEVTIAASFLEFARVPADACVIEVGLGGRLDATNVIAKPTACGIAALGIDHERFLLAPEAGTPDEPIARIAFEKAGVAKPGVPLVTMAYPDTAMRAIEDHAARIGAPLTVQNRNWEVKPANGRLVYKDDVGMIGLPLPSLPGDHQVENGALAVAMLRYQSTISVSEQAMATGILAAHWPARLQQLKKGPITQGRKAWLDGGHNPSAGLMLANYFADQKLHLIIGMIEGKDPSAIIGPLAGSITSMTAVPVPGYGFHRAEAYGENARWADNVRSALNVIPKDGLPVLIAGSLYLAGEVLRQNDEIPD